MLSHFQSISIYVQKTPHFLNTLLDKHKDFLFLPEEIAEYIIMIYNEDYLLSSSSRIDGWNSLETLSPFVSLSHHP